MSQITLPPWAPVRHDRAPWSRNWQCVLDADGRVILTAEEGGPRKGERATYHNAARVVACVNACEGIDDPAATLAEVRDMLNMLSRMSLDGEIEGGMSGDDACETLGALIYKARSILAPKP